MLNLIHSDFGDLTMTEGGKVLCDFDQGLLQIYKVYVLKNKDDAFNSFLSYKAEVENQLDRKYKNIRNKIE